MNSQVPILQVALTGLGSLDDIKHHMTLRKATRALTGLLDLLLPKDAECHFLSRVSQ